MAGGKGGTSAALTAEPLAPRSAQTAVKFRRPTRPSASASTGASMILLGVAGHRVARGLSPPWHPHQRLTAYAAEPGRVNLTGHARTRRCRACSKWRNHRGTADSAPYSRATH